MSEVNDAESEMFVGAPSSEPVQAFLQKLWAMVSDTETNDLICWAENGQSFIVKNSSELALRILPLYFKHRNFTSFVRQLNLYNFIRSNGLGTNAIVSSGIVTFGHPCFQRGQPGLLSKIKRKGVGVVKTTAAPIAAGKEATAPPPGADFSQSVATALEKLQHQQVEIMTTLQDMNRDNRGLWTEMISLRRSVARHEEVIEKLVKFIGHLFKRRTIVPGQKRNRLFEAPDALEAPPAKRSASPSRLSDANVLLDDLLSASGIDCPISFGFGDLLPADEARGRDVVAYSGARAAAHATPKVTTDMLSRGAAAATPTLSNAEVLFPRSTASATPSADTGIFNDRALVAAGRPKLGDSFVPTLPDAVALKGSLPHNAGAVAAVGGGGSGLHPLIDETLASFIQLPGPSPDSCTSEQVLDSGGPGSNVLSPSWGLAADKVALQDHVLNLGHGIDALLRELTDQGVDIENLLDASGGNLPLDGSLDSVLVEEFGKTYSDSNNNNSAAASPASSLGPSDETFK